MCAHVCVHDVYLCCHVVDMSLSEHAHTVNHVWGAVSFLFLYFVRDHKYSGYEALEWRYK